MYILMTKEDAGNIVNLINRAEITGKEAETVVRLKYLVQNGISEAELKKKFEKESAKREPKTEHHDETQ